MNRSGDGLLAEYRRQVLRWNRQINLISRQNTPARLEALVRQCRAAWDGLVESDPAGLMSARSLWYFDLGSGAGLPGYVWHVAARGAGLTGRTWLVEPREKRAWFLERLSRIDGVEPFTVVSGRWGDDDPVADPPDTTPSHILISLKALHLTDPDVLRGLAAQVPAVNDCETVIARFYPPEQKWDDDLIAELDLPTPGETVAHHGREYLAVGGLVLPGSLPDGASLVLSLYQTRG